MKTRREAATRADLIEVMGAIPPKTVQAWVWRSDDKIVALAGWYANGTRAVVFSHFLEQAPKMTVMREARKFMADIKLPSLCVAEERSGRFLEMLGWKHKYMSPEGEVLEWLP